jgi:hypothetical protein
MKLARIAIVPLAALVLGIATGAPAAASAPADSGGRVPAAHPYSYAWDMIDNSLVRPATRFFDVARLGRSVSGHPREAANVDAADQVLLPSTWWQPRLGFRAVTVAQMLRGPGSGAGPAAGAWIVTHTKDEGVTPGFQIEDATGAKFLIKFDPAGSPDLSTGADVIGSYLFWAAGYNVPENVIASFSLDSLVFAKKATYTDVHGRKQPLSREYLEQLLTRVARRPDGRFRCSASRFLKGKPLEAFQYRGRRHDDPEDLVPHELRRELRGLWTVCAWTNHADSRGPNSLDMWVTDGGRSFVRHHLIDFSAILGAGPAGKRAYPTGTEYYVDAGVMGRELVTLGLKPFAWEASVDPEIPGAGFVESRVFDPGTWRPDYPNPAFDAKTDRDARWGARIVAGFTDAHIRAAVAAAQYSDPRAAAYLTRVLIERRDRTVARWLGATPVTPPVPQLVAKP